MTGKQGGKPTDNYIVPDYLAFSFYTIIGDLNLFQLFDSVSALFPEARGLS